MQIKNINKAVRETHAEMQIVINGSVLKIYDIASVKRMRRKGWPN